MLKLAFSNLFKRKMRTFLSLVGIIIGTTAIISLVSVVDGILFDVTNALGQIQQIYVYQKGSPGPLFSRLDNSYQEKLERIRGVKRVTGAFISIASSVDEKPVQFGPTTVRLVGTDYSKADMDSTAAGIGGEIIKGRKLRHGDNGSVIIGRDLADKLDKFVGNKIKIDGKKFKIIGVYQTGARIFNSSILMTIEDLRELKSFPKNKTGVFYLEPANPAEEGKLIELINFKFKNDLKASSGSDFSSTFESVIGSIRLLVIAVAGISAVVAGIGIINTMLMSVIERFKEIGALKATGWTNSNIIKLILIESALIGLTGGIIGMILGYLVSIQLKNIIGLTTIVTPFLAGEAFVFALTIGILGGLYPAWLAGKLNPVEVLRME